MSYRTFKRVLGETSLERKCRFLFGACLLLLITGSFWLHTTATETLVHEKNLSTGRHLVDAGMLKYHWSVWRTEEPDKDFLNEVFAKVENLEYQWSLLSLEKTDKPAVQQPADAKERSLLLDLKAQYEKFLADLAQADQPSALPEAPGANTSQPATEVTSAVANTTDPIKGPAPPSQHRRVLKAEGPNTGDSEYHYYQAVYWKKDCSTIGCHDRVQSLGAAPAHATAAGQDFPFRVVKVVIPYAATQEAINRNRALLLATAIITVFLAMVALYIVVRYVIVKPLQHLRNVSDEISGGNYSVRAEIRTNDEFEDLAHSFNRMLRHLVEAHQELRNLNSDLDAKVDQLAQVNMQLYEANRLKSDFLANMSHELRTPLNSIIGFSDVLQGIDSLNDKQKRYVRNIGQSGRILLDMINDILDLAKMESGKMEVSPSEFSIDAVVQAQCNLVRSLTEEKNIDLDVKSNPQLPRLYQDQAKIQQIITNLLSNAIKFTPEGGRIAVSVERNDRGDLVLCVRDTGVGIAEQDREIIFEKFRQGTALKQGDDLTREYTGTGLGLSIVKELCKLLGGEVGVASEVGKGSAFTVRLPWALDGQPYRDVPLAPVDPQAESPLRAEILASRRPTDQAPLDPSGTGDDADRSPSTSPSSATSSTGQ